MTQSKDTDLDHSVLDNLKSSEAYAKEFRALAAALMQKEKEWLAIELADRIMRAEINQDIEQAYRPKIEAVQSKTAMLRTLVEKQASEKIDRLEKLVVQYFEETCRLKDAISKAQKTRSIKPLASVTERRRVGRPSLDLRGAQLIVESASVHIKKSKSIRAGIIDWVNSHPASEQLNLSRKRDRDQVDQMVEFYRTCLRRVGRG